MTRSAPGLPASWNGRALIEWLEALALAVQFRFDPSGRLKVTRVSTCCRVPPRRERWSRRDQFHDAKALGGHGRVPAQSASISSLLMRLLSHPGPPRLPVAR